MARFCSLSHYAKMEYARDFPNVIISAVDKFINIMYGNR